MRGRGAILFFGLVEALLLMAVVLPVAHMRALLDHIWLGSAEDAALTAPDEPWFIVLRSLLMVLALQTCYALRDLYRWNVIVRPRLVLVRLLEGTITVCIALPVLHYLMSVMDRGLELDGLLWRLQIHPLLVVACSGVAFLTSYGLRTRWPRWIRGAGLAERVALVGRGPMIDILEQELHRRHDPTLELVGFLDQGEPLAGRKVLGPPEEADRLVKEHQLERLAVEDGASLPDSVLLHLRMDGVQVTDASSYYERLTGRISPESLARPDLFLAPEGTNQAYRLTKDLLDMAMAALGLVLASPLILLAALAIKVESRGPVFYAQERTGINGRPFKIYKFRSMRADAESASGPVWASANDDRITRVGRWLRKLRIDEIPQLWSVLRNEMSLVGPRPERPFFVAELEGQIPHYNQRHLVRPGVTGWAQINYTYGSSVDDAFIKLQFDLYYLRNRSLALDLAILLRTVKVVVLQQGAV